MLPIVQTAKARSGYRVQSLCLRRDRQYETHAKALAVAGMIKSERILRRPADTCAVALQAAPGRDLFPKECQQIGIQLVFVRGAEPVRGAGVDLQGCSLHQSGGQDRRVSDGHNLIVVSVDDQGGHVDPFQVFGKVGFREGLDAVENSFKSGLHGLYPEGVTQALGDG